MRQWPFLMLAATALIAASGCNTSRQEVNTVERADPTAIRNVIENRRIIRDSGVNKSVAVLQVIEGRTPDGLLKIGVEVQNQRRKSFRFNYRFDWFDAQGFPVSTPTATMVSKQIEGGQILFLDSVAPNPEAHDFRLTLQESTQDKFPKLRKN